MQSTKLFHKVLRFYRISKVVELYGFCDFKQHFSPVAGNWQPVSLAASSSSIRHRNITDSRSEGARHGSAVLVVTEAKSSHEGRYMCQAKNGVGVGLSKLIKLSVNGEDAVSIALFSFCSMRKSTLNSFFS